MQNQNIHSWSWNQSSAPSFATTQSILPTNFPPGVDQNPLLPGYQPIYANTSGQPLTGYGQWTSAQFQQWQQWQQWQEKYQQWQAQYGKKYAESIAALGQNPNILIPGLPPIAGVPKPVEPVSNSNPSIANPPLPVNTQPVPPPPPEDEKPPLPFSKGGENSGSSKMGSRSAIDNPEELSEAEKTFDIQFKQWEGQFNEWKKQNQDHPDKAQYREYEKKWETWREQLLQRREQMRQKRLNKPTEQTNDGRMEEVKSKSLPIVTAMKLPDSDYSYKTRPELGSGSAGTSIPVPGSEPITHNAVGNDQPKFENKVPFFEGNIQDIQSGPPPLNNFNHPNQGMYSSSNFSAFNSSIDKIDAVRQGGPALNMQNLCRNQVAGLDGNFEKGLGNQIPNNRFENFEGESKLNDFNSNIKNRNQGFDGGRLGGNFDNFNARQRFMDDRNFGSSLRFPVDNFRNERENFNPHRFSDINRERNLSVPTMGHQENLNAAGRGGGKIELNDFRGGNGPPDLKNIQNLHNKPKVPSLFDITVEKPPGLGGPNNDRKSKIWEKYEKDDYYEHPFEKKQEEREHQRNDKPWGNSSVWGKNTTSPWMQPWEIEKLASQKAHEIRPWDRNPLADNKPWLNDVPGKQEIDKAELSGYVGNILAKLGSFNVMPPSLGKSETTQEDVISQGSREGNPVLFSDSNKNSGRSKVMDPERYKEEDHNLLKTNLPPSLSGDNTFRSQNRKGNFGPNGPRDYDQRDNDGIEAGRDHGGFPPINFDHLNESKKDTDERIRFDGEHKNFDVDERIPGRDDRSLFRRDERSEKGSLNRDENRNFPGSNSREDQRNLGNEDRFFGRDDRGFDRGERIFGRFNNRDDVGDRFGNRNKRRGYDRLDRDDRDGRFFDRQGLNFDRFGRNRDQNEPVWNPQVFDYSQGRPQKVGNFDDDFKISTVVDYSHGEKKQTFDYGHGEVINDESEIRSFDYGHKTDTPNIIDYGHGVEKDSLSKDCRRDRPQRNAEQDVDERLKSNLGAASPIKRRSRSPRGRLRSHSRSPHSKFKKESASPPFRISHKAKERLGKPLFRRDRNGSSEDKLSSGEGDTSKHSFDIMTVLVEDLICLPGRETRPNKLVFIMRGIPGSGKTYVTKLIKDKEIELGGDPPRILSLDDYFMTEVEKEVFDKETGRKVKNKFMEYEYEAGMEPHYRGSLLKAFKKTISDGFFSFIIVDSVNEKTKDYEEMWSFAKQKGFQVYIAEMDNDVTICKTRNIHKRTEKDILDLMKNWEQTPSHYLRLDVRSLIQSDAITEVEMEVVSDTELEKTIGKEEIEEIEKKCEENEDEDQKKNAKDEEDEDETGVSSFVKSRWDQFENSEQNLDRLDGLKRRREGFHATMEEYLQLPDELDNQEAELAPGKKKVRWADLEERRQQEKMRAIGFVVGQTDWNRMTDPTFGENALTRTKYI